MQLQMFYMLYPGTPVAGKDKFLCFGPGPFEPLPGTWIQGSNESVCPVSGTLTLSLDTACNLPWWRGRYMSGIFPDILFHCLLGHQAADSTAQICPSWPVMVNYTHSPHGTGRCGLNTVHFYYMHQWWVWPQLLWPITSFLNDIFLGTGCCRQLLWQRIRPQTLKWIWHTVCLNFTKGKPLKFLLHLSGITKIGVSTPFPS